MSFSSNAGALANAASSILAGLRKAGVTEEEIEGVAVRFCDHDLLVEAAKEHGDRILARKIPLEFVQYGETIELEVDLDVNPLEFISRSGLNLWDWQYVGDLSSLPKLGVSKVRVVVGVFNKWLTHATGLQWLKDHPERKLRGSGAWVRDAYFKAFPNYDGKDELAFLDEGASRWQYHWNGHIYFPGLWHDGGVVGPWAMNELDGGWRVGKRYAFVLED